MTHPYDRLPDGAAEIFGAEATAEAAYDLLTVDVPAGSWIASLEIARDKLGCTYFDWLSAVDEPGTGFRVCAHVVALEGGRVRRLLLRTTVPHAAATLPSAVDVYAGAAWHERETYEMFGVTFTDHPNLVPLLLPENFEGHPLRKDFVLAARVAKAWPGAKEPGEGADHGGPKRRTMLPPGVPDPNDWGPLKGQLPPAPARPARTPRAAGDAPARRARTAAAGSASQAGEAGEAPARPVRRARSVAEGSASQAAAGPEATAAPGTEGAPAAPAERPARPPRRTRTAADGSASQAAAPAPAGTEAAPAPGEPPAARSSDAPWHNPRPAFDDAPADRPAEPTPAAEPAAAPTSAPEASPAPAPEASPAAEPAAEARPEVAPEATPAPEQAPEAETAATPAPAPAPEAEAETGPRQKPAAGPATTETDPDTTGGDA
ncbi:NADH-quinone oxidoreductase subunit C [Streptomyces sp. NPDC086023]|uniref:NADH-quinone oxidoreductase subunit C n=1 Tax=Streptomyces sp. NPDC086023 TaxID=3365746 RepID=UPI0037CEF6D4